MIKLIFSLLICLILAACSEQVSTIPTYQIKLDTLKIVVPAKGELEAASSQAIAAPGRQTMTIAWLAEEFQQVKKGEVIAIFDGEQISLKSRREQLAMMLLEKDILTKFSEQHQQEQEVLGEKELVQKEFSFAQSYNFDDLRIYSQLEIIDSMQNTEYLGVKDQFLDWKQQSVADQSKSAVEVLDIKKKGHADRLEKHQQALIKLEVKAPHDGLLVYAKNWRGDKPNIGQSISPGETIAKLPDLAKMQAKLYVLDKEALGLEVGQQVSLALDAYPEKPFSGQIQNVAAFSRTIERGNPTRYFEITVELDQKGNQIFLPGRKLTASITVDEKTSSIFVPLQTIDNENGDNFVYKKQGSRFIKQQVTTGTKNLHFVEIVKGLNDGDTIALSTPDEVSNG